jgi:sigma-B regulation protein RsbU (phosphoserine phosphatase)
VTHLGSIAIRGGASVLEARRKIRAVAEYLAHDAVAATRMATVTSEIVRLYVQQGSGSRLDVACDVQHNGTSMLLDFHDPEASPDIEHLAGFCDRIERLPRREEGRCQRVVVWLDTQPHPSGIRIADLEKIVQQKGRGELLAEIRSKNVELQESLDNLRRTRSAKERMESELNIGREIQMSMLPFTFPAFPHRSDFDVHAALHPAREVGGDFYDLFLIDDNHFCFCVGDVSGKGVPAALFMAVTKTLIKSRAANDHSPASILSHVNTELAQRNESCMFVTVFLAILDVRRGELSYSNAGHNPPYLKRSSGELVRIDQRHGPIIGAAEGLAYTQDLVTLLAGDLVFLYTDGVTEAMNIDNQLYTEERLKNLLSAQTFSSVEEAVKISTDDVWAYQGDAEQADDVTVLSVLYSGGTKEIESHRLELKIVNRLEEITRVNDAINSFAERHGLDPKMRRQLNVVFDELLNNTISYGYEDEDEHEIELTIAVSGGRLYATVSDDGKPFNPFDNVVPDTNSSVEDRPIGGLGVHLVRKVMDRVSYERRGANNVVLLEKQLAPAKE